MERFLVLQKVELEDEDGEVSLTKEPVVDFSSYDEADVWVNEQTDPTLFSIEDQLEEIDVVDYSTADFDELDFDSDFLEESY